MQPIQQYVSVTKAKNMLLDLVRNVVDSDDAVAITKNGVPEAVLISMKKFEGLLETLDILSDEKAMASIKKSISQADKGLWVDLDEVFLRDFRVRFTPEAGDLLKRFHSENKREIRSTINKLLQDPESGGNLQEELFGFKSYKSKRYRTIYKLNEEENVVEVYYVGHRRDVYEQFRSLLNKLR